MGYVFATLLVLFAFSLFVRIVNSMFRNTAKINDQCKGSEDKGGGE